MDSGQLAAELLRLADEARLARERLRELERQLAELRERLASRLVAQSSETPPDEQAETPRQLQSVP